jgi:hypothetical protein
MSQMQSSLHVVAYVVRIFHGGLVKDVYDFRPTATLQKEKR